MGAARLLDLSQKRRSRLPEGQRPVLYQPGATGGQREAAGRPTPDQRPRSGRSAHTIRPEPCPRDMDGCGSLLPTSLGRRPGLSLRPPGKRGRPEAARRTLRLTRTRLPGRAADTAGYGFGAIRNGRGRASDSAGRIVGAPVPLPGAPLRLRRAAPQATIGRAVGPPAGGSTAVSEDKPNKG